jgi:hypothetical protein
MAYARRGSSPRAAPWAVITVLTALLAKSGRNAEQIFADGPAGKLKPFPLGIRATLRTSAAVRRFESENVVGILRGSERAAENVVVSAHIDHLGIGPAIGGDIIWRSIVALAVTGEEKGLQGSEYFTKHPTVPIESIVAARQPRRRRVAVRALRHGRLGRGAQHPRPGGARCAVGAEDEGERGLPHRARRGARSAAAAVEPGRRLRQVVRPEVAAVVRGAPTWAARARTPRVLRAHPRVVAATGPAVSCAA